MNLLGLFFLIMKTLVHFSKLFVRNVGVDLGSRDGSVAEHRLDGADIGAVAQKVGGIGVTKSMTADVLSHYSGFN